MIQRGQTKSISTKEALIKSIDSLFLKLELSYHYQFYKVFGTDEKLKEGKKLWAVSLKNVSSEIILEAVENVIASQSFLPTLTDLLKACDDIDKKDGFPSVEEAYIEARKSYQPRKEFSWSHPIVYYSGKKIGWNLLNERDSKETFQLFRKTFFSLKRQAQEGKKFVIKNMNEKEKLEPLNKNLFKKLRNKHKV
ncbi:MAG: hypothetical protein CMQ83_00260 [Gammaproteobacteria bacterium]|nr:hypothetical protein [Gammaproteobacteria bacterium]|tara:strand:- start:3177 stop:3758 length:582 start_codon:yes stop_codon:yes gene_type:complete